MAYHYKDDVSLDQRTDQQKIIDDYTRMYGIDAQDDTAKKEAHAPDVAQLAAKARVEAANQAVQKLDAMCNACGIAWGPLAKARIEGAAKKAQAIADDYNRMYGIDAQAETEKQEASALTDKFNVASKAQVEAATQEAREPDMTNQPLATIPHLMSPEQIEAISRVVCAQQKAQRFAAQYNSMVYSGFVCASPQAMAAKQAAQEITNDYNRIYGSARAPADEAQVKTDEQAAQEATDEQTAQAAQEATDEQTAQAAQEATDEQMAQAAQEPTDEQTEQAAQEPTDEQAAQEPTDEQTEQAAQEPTDEQAVQEPTDEQEPTNDYIYLYNFNLQPDHHQQAALSIFAQCVSATGAQGEPDMEQLAAKSRVGVAKQAAQEPTDDYIYIYETQADHQQAVKPKTPEQDVEPKTPDQDVEPKTPDQADVALGQQDIKRVDAAEQTPYQADVALVHQDIKRVEPLLWRIDPSWDCAVLVEPKVPEKAVEPKVLEQAVEPKVLEQAVEPKAPKQAVEPKVLEQDDEPEVLEQAVETKAPKQAGVALDQQDIKRADTAKQEIDAPWGTYSRAALAELEDRDQYVNRYWKHTRVEPKVLEQAIEPKVPEQAVEPKVPEKAVEPKVLEQAVEPKVLEQAVEPKVLEQAVEPEVPEQDVVRMKAQLVSMTDVITRDLVQAYVKQPNDLETMRMAVDEVLNWTVVNKKHNDMAWAQLFTAASRTAPSVRLSAQKLIRNTMAMCIAMMPRMTADATTRGLLDLVVMGVTAAE